MSITSAASQAAAQSGAVNTGAAKKKIAADLDAFLKMLTTQLQNQDPLSPMESNEFTQQLVGFAQVEQQIGINENLQTLQTQTGNSYSAMLIGYIGKYAEIQDNLVKLQDGQARFAYGLASEAAEVEVALKDSKGVVIRRIKGETAAGDHIIKWDGRDDEGKELADGDYTIEITATNSAGEKVDTWSTVQALITGVSNADGQPVVIVNDAAVPLDYIHAVTDSPTY